VFSRDGQHAFVPNPENGIEMWEAATGKTLRTFAGRSGLLGVSHAGDLLLSGNMGTIELWITTSGKCVQTIDCRRPVRSATFWPGGKAVLVMLADNTLVLRNLEDGAYLFAADTHNGGVEGIAIARAGQRLAALHRFQITVWDVQSGKRLRALPLDELHLRPFAVSPDGTLAVVGNEQGVVRLLSLDTGESIRTFKHDDRYVGSAVFHPDGNRLITSTSDTVRIWRLDSGECLFTLRNHRKGRGCLALSPDASRLASGAGLGVDVWDTDSGVLTQSMDFGSSNVYVVFTPDGRSLLTLCPLDHVLKWWDMGTGQATRTVPLETDTKGQIVLQGPTWSADFTRLLTVPGPNKTGKETVREWDTLTGKCLRSLPIQLVRHVWVSRYLPNGEHFVTGSYDGTLMLW